ncbi:MAG: YcaO-like family protein [Chloroflexi bacterium]|nr:YcaO-like family protein [Chloroflexota bacterium]
MPIIENCPELGEQSHMRDLSLAGGQRLCPLEETWARVAPHLATAGITRVADITGLDVLGVPVYTAVRPNAPTLAITQGKGLTPLAAKISAVMEAFEFHHAETIPLPTHRATAQELPHHLLAGLPTPPGQTLPTAATPLDWVEGLDLHTGTPTYVPLEACQLVSLSASQPVSPERLKPPQQTQSAIRIPQSAFTQSTNGLAAGNHPLEAIRHALCELLERDALAEWRQKLGRERLRVVDWATVNDDTCQALREQLARAGATAVIWDMRGRWSLPTFGCVLYEAQAQLGWQSVGLFHGFGAHPHPVTALLRALTEAVQSRLAFISGTRDDFFRVDYQLAQADYVAAQWHKLLGAAESIPWDSVPNQHTGYLDKDIDHLLAHLPTAVWVNLTQPAIGISVGRLLVPHLRVDLHGVKGE